MKATDGGFLARLTDAQVKNVFLTGIPISCAGSEPTSTEVIDSIIEALKNA
jgi:hypothetical protein